jgi:hypothetical protein
MYTIEERKFTMNAFRIYLYSNEILNMLYILCDLCPYEMTEVTVTNVAPLMAYKLVLTPRLADNWKLSPVPAIR